MAVQYISKGTVAAGAAAITVGLPATRQNDDLLLLLVETANQAVTLTGTDAANWLQLTSSPQGTGTAAGTAATRLAVYYRWVDGTEAGPGIGDSGDHQIAQIINYRGVDTAAPFNAQAGSVRTTAGTGVTYPSVTTTVADCLVLLIEAHSLPDANSTAITSGQSNANLSSITERADQNTNAGNGGGFSLAEGLKASAGSTGTSSATTTSSVGGMITLALQPAPPAQDLTPSRYDNAQTFYGPTIESGPVNLQPGLYENAEAVYLPTVEATYALPVDRLDNASTVYAPTASLEPYALVPGLLTGTQTFYAATVGRGPVDLAPGRYDNSQTFYAQTLVREPISLLPGFIDSTATVYAPGVEYIPRSDIQVSWVRFDALASAVTLVPSRYDLTNTFYQPTVSAGAVSLQPGLYSNAQAFYAASVAVGTVTLAPGLYSNQNAFYGSLVGSGALVLSPDLYSNANAFLGGVVSSGGSVVQVPRLDNENQFFTATLATSVTLLPTLAQNDPVFYAPTVGNVFDQFLVCENWAEPGWVENGWQPWPHAEVDHFFQATVTSIGGNDNRHEVEFTDTAPRLWWQRRPKAMPVEEAEERVQEVAKVIRRVAKAQTGSTATAKELKRQVREAIEPMVAEMPGFDWVTLWRFINVQVALDEQRQQQEMALMLARQAWEREEDDALVLLMAA